MSSRHRFRASLVLALSLLAAAASIAVTGAFAQEPDATEPITTVPTTSVEATITSISVKPAFDSTRLNPLAGQ